MSPGLALTSCSPFCHSYQHKRLTMPLNRLCLIFFGYKMLTIKEDPFGTWKS